ncbi:MAG: hypothetical protein QOH39_1536 [Verrucomicrobiota bacterium]|jgi:hypothetical protein
MSRLITNPKWRWFTSFLVVIAVTVTSFFLSTASGKQRRVSTGNAVETRAGTHVLAPTGFTFKTPLQMLRTLSPAFFQQGGEPEIKVDLFGNIYVTAIQGVPGGVDLWKSIDKGTSFAYLGQPDGAQDKCGPSGPAPTPVPCPGGLGGGDDQIDVSSGGYLYVSSLWLGNVTMSTSYDGGTGGVMPGQKWEVHPAAAGLPSDDRQWVAAYGPSTVYLAYANAQVISPPGVVGLFVTKSIDGGKTFSAPTPITSPTALDSVNVEGNLVADPYTGNLYTAYLLNASLNAIQVARSTDGGATWSTMTAYTGPAGTNNRGVFPIVAVDRGGNLHLVFTRVEASGACHIWMTSSANPAAATPTWLPAVQVDSGSGNTTTAVEPWVVAGSAGRVDIAWLGSPAANPDVVSNWQLFFAQTTNALSGSPLFNQVQVTTNQVHSGSICFNGSGCANASTPHGEPGNRDMAEYFTMTLDGDGNANIAFPDSVNNCDPNVCVTNAWFTKQTGGTSAYAPPPGPAPVTFGPNIHLPGSDNNNGEPSLAVDSHNCIYASALGAAFWASENGGYTFRNTTAPPALGGGDEDLVTVPQANGARNDSIYYGDLLLADIDVFKSTDRGVTWSNTATPYGHLNASSDRQWFAADRINANANQIIWEMDHELASEDIRVAASIDDSVWGTTSAIATCSMPTAGCDPELGTTIPNTNPGPVFVNKVTHQAIGVFLASTITTNTADPPFGKEPNLWNFVASPPALGGGPPLNVANYPIFKGVIDSPATAPAGTTTYGTHLAAIFPSGDADSAGNVYAVWSMLSARPNATIGANPATTWDIWFASSHDGGKTFYGPFKVSSATGTAVFPWIAAGDAGKVDIAWYQANNPAPPLLSDPTSPAELTGGPNSMPAGTFWNVMFAQSVNADSREPSFTTVQASDNPNHRGSISIGGTTGSADRSLADYFNVYVGPDGIANIMYTDNANATGSEINHVAYVRQNGGPIALNNPSGVTCLGGAPIPIKVVSQKTHANGTFEVNLPLAPHGIECRRGQPGTDQHKVVFTFPVPVTLTSATITSGNGTVNSTTISGNTVTVNLTASPGPQKIVIKLTGVNDSSGNSGDISWPMDILLADVNASASVDSGDVFLLQQQNGQALPPTGSADFRRDINLNGSIDSGDVFTGQKQNPSQLPP